MASDEVETCHLASARPEIVRRLTGMLRDWHLSMPPDTGEILGREASSAAEGIPPMHFETRRIFANARHTAYQHRTDVDPSAGRYRLDCSGLVALVLGAVAPTALE